MAELDVTVDANLTSNTSIATNDRLLMIDAGTGTVQDITPEELLKILNSLTEDTSPASSSDFLLSFDTSAGMVKKVKPRNLTTPTKGRVEVLAVTPPTTLAAPMNVIAGGSSPVEQVPIWEHANGSITYKDYYCRLVGYNGGGLTLSTLLWRTSASAAATYIIEAAIRRLQAASEDVTASQTYDYNAVTVTIPSGPPAAGIPMLVTITFTDGSDMDSLADGDFFILRVRRNGGTATDTAQLLAGISMKET